MADQPKPNRQRPSVGRAVHYTPNDSKPGEHHAATIAYVCPEGGGCNLAVVDPLGRPYPKLRVSQTDAPAGTDEARGKWAWPAFVPPKT